MYRLIEFLRSIYVFLLFVLLECCAILYYAHSNSYTEAKIIGTSAHLSANVGEVGNFVSSYFSLREENGELLLRISELEAQLNEYKNSFSDSLLNAQSLSQTLKYSNSKEYIAAKVLLNSINKQQNYMIINRGLNDGVKKGMAVISPDGAIVGVVEHSSGRFASVMSILNRRFRSSGQLKVGSHAGSIYWDGTDRYSISMNDLSKYAEPFVGAEVVTTSFSQIFPEDLKIGTVSEFSLNEAKTAYKLKVALEADLSSLKTVIVVGETDYSEQQYLLDIIEDEKQTFQY